MQNPHCDMFPSLPLLIWQYKSCRSPHPKKFGDFIVTNTKFIPTRPNPSGYVKHKTPTKGLTFILYSCFKQILNQIFRCVHLGLFKKPTFFTIQFIFATIYGSHCTFWYYSLILLYYFSYLLALYTVLSTKKFQFQLNKLFPNRH